MSFICYGLTLDKNNCRRAQYQKAPFNCITDKKITIGNQHLKGKFNYVIFMLFYASIVDKLLGIHI